MCRQFNLPLLESVPLDLEIATSADKGQLIENTERLESLFGKGLTMLMALS